MAAESGIDGFNDYSDQGEAKGLIELIADHDRNTSNFHDLLQELGSNPTKINNAIDDINFCASKVATSWMSVVEGLVDGRSLRDEEFLAELSTLWLDDESKRLGTISQIAPNCPLEKIADGESINLKHMIISAMDQMADYYSDGDLEPIYAEVLKQSYVENFTSDIRSFLGEVESESYQQFLSARMSRRDRIKQALPKLGAHTLDITKVALGVSAGVLIGSFFRKKH